MDFSGIINNVVAIPVNRTVTVYSERYGKNVLSSKAVTWGDLKQEIDALGYLVPNNKYTEGNTMVTLENDDAVLPTNFLDRRNKVTNDLVVIMTPNEKPKSGADYSSMSRNELFRVIAGLRRDPNTAYKAREHFAIYSNLKNAVLVELLTSWDALSVSTPTIVERIVEKIVEVGTPINEEVYDTAIKHIIYGITLLQNEVKGSLVDDTFSEEELDDLLNSIE